MNLLAVNLIINNINMQYVMPKENYIVAPFFIGESRYMWFVYDNHFTVHMKLDANKKPILDDPALEPIKDLLDKIVNAHFKSKSRALIAELLESCILRYPRNLLR